jgi:tetratricopeptide (TPR) repeat protein
LADGNALFQAQNFHGALQKYKLSAAAAPDLAEPHWRQGHAAIATNNLELATAEFKRALALSEDLTRGGFRLDDLYGRAALAKAAHQERLAAWALEKSDASDPFFLIGVTLAYDGQAERAAKFFVRAAEFAGVANGHIAAFLERGGALAAPAAAPVPPADAPTVPVSLPTEI